jgi:hypothetical protein
MKSKALKTKPEALVVVVVTFIFGCALSFLGGRWFETGKIEYWTGPSEKHHFLATPNLSPITYWMLVFFFCFGAIALLAMSIV